ncbi:meckelin-like isoform X2 [Ambystoma mexicanum]
MCLNSSCACGANSVRDENIPQRTAACTGCSSNTVPNPIGSRCVLCQQTYTNSNNTICQCTGKTETGGLCLVVRAPTMRGTTLWENMFIQAAYGACQDYNNVTSCQMLMNMNAMNVFSASSDAELLQATILNSGNTFMPTWNYSTATLAYSSPTNLAFMRNSKMPLQVAKYDVRGNFLGWQDVSSGTLQLCPNTPSILDAAYAFGTTYNQSCTMQVSDLLQRFPEPVFYQLYLQYNDSSGKPMLLMVPVQNTNIQTGRQAQPRFFLVDGLSGRTGSLDNTPTTVNIATSIVLSIYLPMPTTARTTPPFMMTVQYQKVNNNTSVQVAFAVVYTQDSGNYKLNTDISLGVIGSAAALYAILETSSWVRRSGLQNVQLTVVVKFFAFLAGSLANTFFMVAYGTAVYWLIVFKGQRASVDVTLPPAGGQVERDFTVYLSCAFALKALELIHLLVTQLTISIFLIDWEKPKERPSTNAERGKPSVSIWRTFLVANEWNEIQTNRKLSPTLQIVAVLLLLEVVGLKNIASKDLNLDLHPADGTYLASGSIILRFGVSVSMWLAVALVQILFVVVIYERFVEDKLHNFVDLCSLSNVSVFVLMHRCYGFYIHGRSVHGQADVSMETMLAHLKKEEENLCPLRGLEPSSDVQTFEVLLSDRVRHQYEKILQPLLEAPTGMKARIDGNPLMEQRMKTYYTFNRFLSAFLEHVYKDMDYMVKDKVFLERIMGMEFQQPIERSILYNDDRGLFSKVLFYGNELVLLLFDILLFSVVDLGAQNFVLAAIITYIVQKLVVILRATVGRKNLSKQTMVEEQFLI